MLYLAAKATLSDIIIAAMSEIARRQSGGIWPLVALLPLISILGMIWLWRDPYNGERLAAHASATFWYVLPSLPMFLHRADAAPARDRLLVFVAHRMHANDPAL